MGDSPVWTADSETENDEPSAKDERLRARLRVVYVKVLEQCASQKLAQDRVAEETEKNKMKVLVV